MADYSLSLSVLGADELREALSRTDAFARGELAKALNKAANDARQKAAEEAPHATGALKDSLHTEYATPDNLVSKVGTGQNIPYARAQEYGTIGMAIRGRSKLGKQFTYIGNIKPKLYMKQARDYVRPKLSEYLRLAATRIVSQMAGK